MPRLLYLITLVFFSASTFALDKSDVGTYGVLTKDQTSIGSVITISRSANKWDFYMKMKENGLWAQSSCEGGCELKASGIKNTHRMFSKEFLEEFTPDCINNKAMAFCRLKSEKYEDAYLMVALTTSEAIAMPLVKLSDIPKDDEALKEDE
ncbi:hypothetical protein [Serratia oryzae]|uniref:hypothetical protein n=1 Tax=Serratia oryzae TaxID=2034155 RepID=UPI0012E25DA8|nr:hypothetical protein [Serratia oryzae]VXC53239.1 exported hypothetical protein [Enterobacterales bacterium 8AC]